MLIFWHISLETTSRLSATDPRSDAEIITQSSQYKNGFHFSENDKPSSEVIPNLLNYVNKEDDSCYQKIMKNQKESCQKPDFQEKQRYCIQLTECYMNYTGHKDQFFNNNTFYSNATDAEKLANHSEFANQIFMLFQDNWEQICSLHEQNKFNQMTSEKLEKLLSSILNATTLIEEINQTFHNVEEGINNNTAGVIHQLNQSRLNLLEIIHSLDDFNILKDALINESNESLKYIQNLQFYGLIIIVFGLLAPSLVRIFLTILFADFCLDYLLLRYIPGWASFSFRYTIPKISALICLVLCIKKSVLLNFLFGWIFSKKKKPSYSYRMGPAIMKPKNATVKYSRYYHP